MEINKIITKDGHIFTQEGEYSNLKEFYKDCNQEISNYDLSVQSDECWNDLYKELKEKDQIDFVVYEKINCGNSSEVSREKIDLFRKFFANKKTSNVNVEDKYKKLHKKYGPCVILVD